MQTKTMTFCQIRVLLPFFVVAEMKLAKDGTFGNKEYKEMFPGLDTISFCKESAFP